MKTTQINLTEKNAKSATNRKRENRLRIIVYISLFIVFSTSSQAIALTAGCDLNNDGEQGLYEAIHSLHVLSGKTTLGKCATYMDGKEGMMEAIQSLRVAANLEPNCVSDINILNTNTGFASTIISPFSDSVRMIENNSSFAVTVLYQERYNTTSVGSAIIDMVSPLSFTLQPGETFDLEINYKLLTCPASAQADYDLSINAVPESGCFFGTGSSLQVDLNCTPFVSENN